MRKSPEELDKVFSKLREDEVLPSENEFEKLFASLDAEKAQKSKKETRFLLKIAASLSLFIMAAIMLFKGAADDDRQLAASKSLETKTTISQSTNVELSQKEVLPSINPNKAPAERNGITKVAPAEVFQTEDKRREIELADGSKIILNKHSELRTEVNFGKDNRTVYLSGEAFFEVKKNAGLPFIIYTAISKTQVVGTSFNIRSVQKGSEEISVLSGKVKYGLKKADDPLFLVAGNKCVIEDQSLKKLESFDVNLLAWKDDKIVFEKTSLNNVVNDLEAYFNIKINVENPDILKCRYTGSFEKPILEDVLDIISFSNDLKYQKNGDVYILSGKGCRD